MSEEGWRDFLVAGGVDDWVALHGGATAGIPRRIDRRGGRLAEAIADVLGLEESGAMLTIASDRPTVRLTRDMCGSWSRGTWSSRRPSRPWHDQEVSSATAAPCRRDAVPALYLLTPQMQTADSPSNRRRTRIGT